jgi:hypothetical protein
VVVNRWRNGETLTVREVTGDAALCLPMESSWPAWSEGDDLQSTGEGFDELLPGGISGRVSSGDKPQCVEEGD